MRAGAHHSSMYDFCSKSCYNRYYEAVEARNQAAQEKANAELKVKQDEEWKKRAQAARQRREREASEAATVKCSGCGAALPPNAKFCQGCGAAAPVSAEAVCACGTKLAAGAKFCPECGKPAAAQEAAGPRTGPPPPPKPPAGMVRIVGGTFIMGSPNSEEGREEAEGPQHKVTLDSFYLGIFHVTQKEYMEITGINPSAHQDDEYMPVTDLLWDEIAEYCNQRSKREGLTPVYTIANGQIQWNREAKGYRLPTEAEWEYACRAGTTTPWNTGSSISAAQANFDHATNKPTPVGAYPPNKWGLYDMHGNVWELCWPAYEGGSFDKKDKNNPGVSSCMFPPPAENKGLVYRGTNMNSNAVHIRSAFRKFWEYKRWPSTSIRLTRNI